MPTGVATATPLKSVAGAVAMIVAAATGAGTTAGILASREPEPRVIYVDREAPSAPTLAPSPALSSTPPGDPVGSASAAVSPSEPGVGTGPAISAPGASAKLDRDALLAMERVHIDTARSALASGNSAAALAALNRHAREFPRGRLSEEREALTIHALLASGSRDAAAARADAFRRTYPRSLFLPPIDRALYRPDAGTP